MKKFCRMGLICFAVLLSGCGGNEAEPIVVSPQPEETVSEADAGETVIPEMPEEKGPAFEYRGPEGEGDESEEVKFGKYDTEVVSEGELANILNNRNPVGELAEGEELMCLADSEAEAQKIAEQYGISLVLFNYGVATFHTEEDPSVVIQRGIDNGWPELSLNRANKLEEPQKPLSETRN